jgi:hypothetical protein
LSYSDIKLFQFYRNDSDGKKHTGSRMLNFFYFPYDWYDKKTGYIKALHITEQTETNGTFLYPDHSKRLAIPIEQIAFDINTRPDVARKFVEAAFLGHYNI